MCGIYGMLHKKRKIRENEIEILNNSFKKNMGHRGPDDSGHFVSTDRRLILGHLRLSIIDIENGKQPMYGSDGRNVAVFNGEIYNFRDLRASSNYKFNTISDTETILAEYEKNSRDVFDNLNGMYGIALYDENLNTLFLAVDPVGVKSIYVFENEDYIVFSSELVPLCIYVEEGLSLPNEADMNATLDFLYHGVFLNETTPVKGINKILPGKVLTYCLNNSIKSEYEIKYKSRISSRSTLSSLISSATERQLISDVPVCLFLSGGIDSSLLAAELSSQNRKIKCFTFSFIEDSSIDESIFAKTLSNELDLDCEVVQMNSTELFDCFISAVEKMDEPISDFALIPLMKLSKVAGKNFKVCILGDGGDELFFGYTHHRFWKFKVFLAKRFLESIRLPLFIEILSYKFEHSKIKILRKMALLARNSTPYSSSYGPFSNCTSLLKLKVTERKLLRNYEELKKWERVNSLNRKLLQKTDRITMSQGLEARVPLLDLDLVEFSERFGINNCLLKRQGKAPLRKLLSEKVSSKITSRKKQGFRTPASKWLRGSLGDHVYDTISSCENISIFVDKNVITRLFDEHKSDVKDHSSRILTLYTLSTFWNKIKA